MIDVHHPVIAFPDSRIVLKSLRIILGDTLRRHRIISFETPSKPDDLYGLKMYDADSSLFLVIVSLEVRFHLELKGVQSVYLVYPNIQNVLSNYLLKYTF